MEVANLMAALLCLSIIGTCALVGAMVVGQWVGDRLAQRAIERDMARAIRAKAERIGGTYR